MEWSLQRHQELSSTNQEALHLAEQGAREGTVVVARRQRSGRGRLERVWHSPEGGLWFSVVLRPRILEGLNLLGALACTREAERSGVDAQIRWPNDVMVGSRKLAGVLSEGRFSGGRSEHAVLGIGFNANLGQSDFPLELSRMATSLFQETGRVVELDRLLDGMLAELSGLYPVHQEKGLAALLPEILQRCDFLGRAVRLTTPDGERVGVARGLDSDGALVLEDGSVHYSAERLELLDPPRSGR